MSQCPYRIKDALGIGWWNCQLEANHGGEPNHHVPPRNAKEFEGIWHLPGEKSTADPGPAPAPAVVSVWQNTRPPQILKETTVTPNSTEVRSTK